MDKKPVIDISVIAPILLGIFSLFGVCVILGAWLIRGQRTPAPVSATETPFRYLYLGTEPGLSTLTPEPTETSLPTETAFVIEPPASTAGPEFLFTPSPSSLITLPPNGSTSPTKTPTRVSSPTITPTLQAVLSKVDDTYFEIIYDGDWTAQSNVTGAHQNTLHISFTVSDTAQFTFVGQQVLVSYQSGPSLGKINIDLDGSDFELDQSGDQTEIVDWRSPVLIRGTHTLLIEHISGGSVNLDSLTIPDLSTPTPTPTP